MTSVDNKLWCVCQMILYGVGVHKLYIFQIKP